MLRPDADMIDYQLEGARTVIIVLNSYNLRRDLPSYCYCRSKTRGWDLLSQYEDGCLLSHMSQRRK